MDSIHDLFNITFVEYFATQRLSECSSSINRDKICRLHSSIIGEIHATTESPYYEQIAVDDDSLLLKVFRFLAYFVEKQSLHPSSNEILEDIPTENLKLLLIPFILGDLSFQQPSDRLVNLHKAKMYFTYFLELLVRIEVLRREDHECWDTLCAEKPPLSPADSRTDAINRLKYQRDVDTRLKEAFDRACAKFPSLSKDEEEERTWLIELLQRFGSEAPKHVEMIVKEIPLQEMYIENQRNPGTPPKLEPPKFKKQDIKVLKLLFRDSVFGPSHRLPTISLEECAEMEMRLMQKTPENSIVETVKTDAELRAEEELKEVQDRNWDDWKDENPKGLGNKKKNTG